MKPNLQVIVSNSGFRTFLLACIVFLTIPISSYSQGENWRKITEMPNPRYGAGSCILDGKIYVIGGMYSTESSPGSPAYHPVDMVNSFDPETGVWDTLAPLKAPRVYLQAVEVEGKIYAMGGAIGEFEASTAMVEVYDIGNDRWESIDDMPVKRFIFGACVLEDQIYVMGGIESFNQKNPLKSMHKYDPATGTWDACANLSRGTSGLTATSFNGIIYAITGGVHGTYGEGIVEAYDPAEDVWIRKASMSGGRFLPACGVVNERIYVNGGLDRTYPPNQSSTEIYNPSTDTWIMAASEDFLPIKISDHSIVTLDKKVYVFGGSLEGPIHWAEPDVFEFDFPVVRSRSESMLTSNDTLEAEFYEDGTLYIVPEGTLANKDSIFESEIKSLDGVANQFISIQLDNVPEGSYEIFGIASDGRLDSGSSRFQVVPVGMDQGSVLQVQIFPNPANDLITLQTNQSGRYTYNITSVNGQMIRNGAFTSASHQIDLSNLEEGIYFITIRSRDLFITKKIIKR